jgi:hypothetical protein
MEGISLLGTAMGNDQYVGDFLQQRTQKTENLLNKVNKITSLQAK